MKGGVEAGRKREGNKKESQESSFFLEWLSQLSHPDTTASKLHNQLCTFTDKSNFLPNISNKMNSRYRYSTLEMPKTIFLFPQM